MKKGRFSSTKKIVLFAVLFCFMTGGLFAYEGIIEGGYDGNVSRVNYGRDAANIDYVRGILTGTFGSVSTLFQITQENADDEDMQVLNDVELSIRQNYAVSNNDCFSYMVARGESDGWLVLTHYTDANGFFNYLWYFSLE